VARANGEGSIQRRSDGRWHSRLTLPDGHRKSLYGKTRTEASHKLAAAQAAVKKNVPLPSAKLLVHDYLDAWLAAHKPALQPRTATKYVSVVRLHTKAIGDIPLQRLSAQDLRDLYTERRRSGQSATSVGHIHSVLHNALHQAMRDGILDRNVADLVSAPRRDPVAQYILTQEELVALFSAAKGDRLEALYVLAAHTGLRQGELLALRWADVDFERRFIHVRGSLQRDTAAGGLSIKVPKNRSSIRPVALSHTACEALRSHRAAVDAERAVLLPLWQDNDLVFPNLIGKPLEAGNMMKRGFRPLLRKAGLPETILFKDFRAAFATLTITDGVPITVVARMMGHSKTSTTVDMYARSSPDMQTIATDALDRMFGRHEENSL